MASDRNFQSNVLIVRHLPMSLDASDKEDLLKHFGAVSVKCMADQGRMKHTAFATFTDYDAATQALHRLHQLDVLGQSLTVEYARTRTQVALATPDLNNRSSCSRQGSIEDRKGKMAEKETKSFAAEELHRQRAMKEMGLSPDLGIGKATAKLLAQKKARVIIACRNVEKGSAAVDEIVAATGNKDVRVKKLDLSSLASVRSFAKELKEEESSLHVLINNAGILAPAKKTITEDQLEMTYATNHFGPFLLTNLLLELLQKSAPSRIINVSSVVYAVGHIRFDNLCAERFYSNYMLYSNTKLANILFTRELSKRLEGTGVTANCLHPGTVRTSLLSYRPELKFLSFIMGPLFWKDPEMGAQTSLYLAVSDDVKHTSGCYFDNCRAVVPSARARDDGIARKLWEISEKLTGLYQ